MRGREDRSCRARKIHGEGQLAVVAKVDLKKERKHLYNPSAKQASVLDLAQGTFLMVDGKDIPTLHESTLELGRHCIVHRLPTLNSRA
jgi:hypothetical protein